jgi:hypothetical protein
MKLWDWQHTIIAVALILVTGGVIALGHGQIFLQILAACGGIGGIAALLKPSPVPPPTIAPTSVEFPVDEPDTTKEGKRLP